VDGFSRTATTASVPLGTTMTDSELRIPNPMTEDEFETALGRLLRRAHDNDIDVRTGWMYRHDERYPDWNVEITEVVE
jgi:hypothetical protein